MSVPSRPSPPPRPYSTRRALGPLGHEGAPRGVWICQAAGLAPQRTCSFHPPAVWRRPVERSAETANGSGSSEGGGGSNGHWLHPWAPHWAARFGARSGASSPPTVELFDSLPALACNVRDPVGPDGIRGLTLARPPPLLPLFVPRGSLTCDAPVDGSEAGAQLGVGGLPPGATHRPNCTTRRARFHPFQLVYPLLPPSLSARPRDRSATLGQGYGGEILPHAPAVARLLALQRNTLWGSVARHKGLYDVVAVSRVTNGVCLDAQCLRVAAVQTVGGRDGRGMNRSYALFPVVTFQADGQERPTLVSDRDSGLFTLRRAALADAGWLGNHPAWQPSLRAYVDIRVAPSGSRSDELPSPLWDITRWSLNGPGSAHQSSSPHVRGPARWLQAVHPHARCLLPPSSPWG